MPCFEQVSESVEIRSSSNYTIACGTLHIFRCVIQGKEKKKRFIQLYEKEKKKRKKGRQNQKYMYVVYPIFKIIVSVCGRQDSIIIV